MAQEEHSYMVAVAFILTMSVANNPLNAVQTHAVPLVGSRCPHFANADRYKVGTLAAMPGILLLDREKVQGLS